jgi:PRC-barrel domain
MLQRQVAVDQLAAMRNTPAYDSNGEKIGEVEEVYYDETTPKPQWIGIGTGVLGMKHAVVPLAGATMSADGVTVRYSKAQVKDAPEVDIYASGIGVESEESLYGYYGLELEHSELDFDNGLPDRSLESELRGEG